MRVSTPCLAVLLGAACAPVGSEGLADAGGLAERVRAAVDSAVQGAMAEPGAVGLVVGVVDGDRTVLVFKGETVHGGGHPPDATTLFELGSLTKTFTATLLAAAVQGGQLALSDRLDGLLPPQSRFEPGSAKLDITLEELAVHTSGLPRNPTDVPAGAAAYQASQLLADAQGLTLQSTPGQQYLYSNLGYGLLGLALEAGGQPWEAQVQATLSQPLGLLDVGTYQALDGGQRARAATGYTDTAFGACHAPPCPVSPSVILLTFPQPAVHPAAGLYATPADVLRWLQYNLGQAPDAGLDGLLPSLRQPRVAWGVGVQGGLAWNTSATTLRGRTVDEVWKDGATNGFRSFIGYAPAEGVGVFVLANFPVTPSPQALGEAVLARLP